MLEHYSLADVPEGHLVKSLLSDAHWRSRVIGLHGIPDDVIDYLEVPLNGLRQLQGDIDILLVPPGRPDRATAIQVNDLILVAGKTWRIETVDEEGKTI